MTEEEKKERQRINFKKYYESHKEKCLARSKEWAKKNPEKAKEIQARYFAKYYAENKDKIAKRRKELHPRKMVEVVRCKDCKHRPELKLYSDRKGNYTAVEFPNGSKCPCQCEDFFYSWYPKDDWFCANGERRDDDA